MGAALTDFSKMKNLSARKILSAEEKEAWAYEMALGYFEPEELRKVFKLLPEGFAALMDSKSMQVRIAVKRREIDQSPDALRIHARRAARIAIDELGRIVKDAEAPAKTRMEAGRQLREYAMVADKEALDDGPSEAVIIRTNLDMGSARGVYTVTAEEIEEQLEESTDEENDFADLLGVAG